MKTRLAYDDIGNGVPVIMLHGNFTSRQWWKLVVREHPAGLRFILPDLPGHGDTPIRDGEVTIENYAKEVLAFADDLALDRFWLVGLSLGGATAQGMASLAPERICGLLLTGSPAPTGLFTPEERYPVLESFIAHPEYLKPALAAVTPFCADPIWFDEAVAEARRMDPRLYTANARAAAAMDFRAALAQYHGPALAIRGAKDYLITDAHQAEIQQVLPQLKIEVWQDAGHSPPSDQPVRFATRLKEFVEST